MTIATNILRSEHCEMECILNALSRVVDKSARDGKEPDFECLWLLLDWIESFPDTFHHPKEEDFLFPILAERNPEAGDLIDDLREEHVKGIAMMDDLRRNLEAYRRDLAAGPRFWEVAKAYVAMERRHIRTEEQWLLPLALRSLADADWVSANRAFLDNVNPLLGRERRLKFDEFFVRILHRVSDNLAA